MAEELLEEFLSREFPGAEREKTHCGGVPVGPCLKSLVSGGVMIAGDAARQVNALTGAGIAYSLFAGKTAGTVAARSFCGKECNHRTLKDYEKIWKARCGKQQHRSYLLKEALLTMDDAFFNEVAHRLSREDPRNISYRRVFLKTFFGRPMLLLKVFQLFR